MISNYALHVKERSDPILLCQPLSILSARAKHFGLTTWFRLRLERMSVQGSSHLDSGKSGLVVLEADSTAGVAASADLGAIGGDAQQPSARDALA